ncbi:MAG TPA: Hsp20 family protein [Alphaproteobacteria bacterium]
MVNFDFSPLFRSTVGFDRLSRLMESNLAKTEAAYPPYNIEKTGEDQYRITLAVAGFDRSELDVTVQENKLIVSGKLADAARQAEESSQYLYRGIAGRAFRHTFELADNVKVGGADLVNGLLHIDLKREIPEQAKPRRVEIAAGEKAAPAIDSKAAA